MRLREVALALLIPALLSPLNAVGAAPLDAATQQARLTQYHQADTDLQAAQQEAWVAARTQVLQLGNSQKDWLDMRHIQCFGSMRPLPDTAVVADLAKVECYVRISAERAAAYRRLAAEARAGSVSPETMRALQGPFVAATHSTAPAAAVPAVAAAPTSVNPMSGSGARIEHSGATATLSYTDAGGTAHHYAVMRPKFAQSMPGNADQGAWIYVAPDHQSGVTFNVAASGQVTGSPLNPMMLRMATGQ